MGQYLLQHYLYQHLTGLGTGLGIEINCVFGDTADPKQYIIPTNAGVW